MAKSIHVSEATANQNLRDVITKLQINACDMVLNTAGLAIKAGGSALAKSVNTIIAMIDGVLVSKAAADMPALVGTIAASKYGLFVFSMNASGTLTTTPGTLTAAARANLVFPTVPANEVVVGFIIVQNGSASAFTGGTTALDATDITTTYVNTPFPFNPNALSL